MVNTGGCIGTEEVVSCSDYRQVVPRRALDTVDPGPSGFAYLRYQGFSGKSITETV